MAWPVHRLMVSPTSDGAAAVVLAAEDVARRVSEKPVWIEGVGWNLDSSYWTDRDLYYPDYVEKAARMSYEMAGIREPLRDLDLAELHDAFTGTEIMSYEDCFFCEPGEGGRLIDEGTVWPGGRLPVNLSGGLIGCGHAVGATGLMQTAEVVWHLRGEAGERQVSNARRGLVQSIGGTLCAWTVSLVLERIG